MKKKYLIIRWLIAMLIIIAAITVLVYYFWFPIRFVFSGNFLESRFKLPSELAGDSYQVGINRMLICGLFLLCIGIPVLLSVRWLMDRSGAFGKWLFIAFSSTASLFPLCFFIIAFHMILQYIWAMGISSKRLLAIAITAMLIVLLIAAWRWSIRLPIKSSKHTP